MKILTNKIYLLFLMIVIVACGDTTDNDKKEMITNLLEKQLQTGMSWENDVTDVSNEYIYTEEDLDVSSYLIRKVLSKRGFKSDSLLFRSRVKELFGFSVTDTLPIQIVVNMDGDGYSLLSYISVEMFDRELTPAIILSVKDNIIVFPYYIPEIVDYRDRYPDVAKLEENMPTTKNSWFGEATVSRWRDYEKELKDQRKFNIQNLFHVNNYLVHNEKISLTWLAINNRDFLTQLLTIFGYDKEDEINKLVLDEIPKDESGGYSGESFNGIFTGRMWVCADRLDIRENLLKYIQKNPNNSYATMLDVYGRYCLAGAPGSDFTREERFAIAAYMAYYLRLIHLDNSNRDSATDEYIITNNMLFRAIGDLVNQEGNPSNVGEDSEFLNEIRANDYYDLPNFKEMIDVILNDCRDGSVK